MLTPGCLFARGTILKTMFPHSIIFLINEDDYVAIREITALDTHDIINAVEQGIYRKSGWLKSRKPASQAVLMAA